MGIRPFTQARNAGFESGRWPIPIDVVNEGKDVVVRASLPGFKPEDISVTLEDHTLSIRGETSEEKESEKTNFLMRERRTGRFGRSLRLPRSVDMDNAKPTYENGVLTITIPRLESSKSRRLEIKAQ